MDINKLLNQLANQEQALQEQEFLAPCVAGGRVKTAIASIAYSFQPQPPNFEGWGIFQPLDTQTAQWVDEPTLPQIGEYLNLLKPLRFWLSYRLQGQTWLAYPVNGDEAKKRYGITKPTPVHLVTEGGAFETIIARGEGASWWFEGLDRRADPQIVDTLKHHLKQLTDPDKLQFSGMTPEAKITYELVAGQQEEFSAEKRDRRRLNQALQQGGGALQDFADQGDYWRVEWTTVDGEHHVSAISKADLTVVSSGICLSGRDRDFDLQSLVGVIEDQ
ncbi:hypothetical protein [Roseofilum capinflatum]|uniref:Uncharacterized protein n=1 Tax=Roseofilum capinflatum BLCC-M114 TaxID=3022440 RepID=A0ABT7B5R0_9CYAN|nr:hypothetical protein [Roseofilum capinflatum]MDJ1174508.1 hypothetical protein [Roseofilum capinflatum BLCC-M114]